MKLQKPDIISKLKPLVLIPLLVLFIVLSVRACLEMVFILSMTESFGMFSDELNDRDTTFGTSDLIGSSSSPVNHHHSHSSSLRPPSPSSISRERSQFGWNSGRSSNSQNNQYTSSSFNSNHLQHVHKIDSSSLHHTSTTKQNANNIETSFLTNIMVVSLLWADAKY